jgi:hypothetical protein
MKLAAGRSVRFKCVARGGVPMFGEGDRDAADAVSLADLSPVLLNARLFSGGYAS